MYRTFKGFLASYLAELSGVKTSSLRILCNKARSNARLVEPLFLFAAVQGKAEYLLDISDTCWFHDQYEDVARCIAGAGSVEEYLLSDAAPKRYASVFDAFRAQGDLLDADQRLNALMRPKILAALERAGVTRYRLCKDLHLNMGNAYAYLAGDETKVSHATAARMLAYAQGL